MADLLQVCKVWKRKKKCPNESDSLLPRCWRTDCEGYIHVGCSTTLLDINGIPDDQRPTEDDPPLVFCTKTCFLKWKAYNNRKIKAAKKGEEVTKKTRIPWEEDGSMEVLMDWMTTEGNYASYCGASSNNGTSKSAYHKQVALLIQDKKPEADRSDKDVENKITTLERQYRDATDWKNNTGAGLDDPGAIDAYIKKKCPYYDELDAIMSERPNTKPIASNESSDDSDGDIVFDPTELDPTELEMSEQTQTALEISVQTQEKTPPKSVDASSITSGSLPSSTTRKRLTAGSTAPHRKKKSTDDIISNILGDDDEFKSLRSREVQAKEKEADARMLEAAAVSAKVKKESEILDIDLITKKLRARHALVQEGVCTKEEVEKAMPLK